MTFRRLSTTMRGVKHIIFKVLQAILFSQARMIRRRTTGPVIAVVGSVGKTSTKDALAIVVRHAVGAGNCFVTAKSLNAELGVPLTMLGFNRLPHGIGWLVALGKAQLIAFFGIAPKAMVVELGEENRGDLATFARLVRPTHLVFTELSEAHSAYLGSVEDIEKEFLSVVPFLATDGTIIVNADNPKLAALKVSSTQTKINVRLHARADYFSSGAKVTPDGTTAIIHHANRTQKVTIKRWGEHHIYAVLFMAALADFFEVRPTQQLTLFKSLRPSPGRGVLIEGKKGSVILDDSYNAQPAAMVAALEALRQFPAKTKIAILGDMRELAQPESHHLAIGKLAREVADYIIAVGPESKRYGANEWYLDAASAGQSALRLLAPGVIVLVKGSQNTIRLERAVKVMMAHPEDAPKKLVRQEKEWLNIP